MTYSNGSQETLIGSGQVRLGRKEGEQSRGIKQSATQLTMD